MFLSGSDEAFTDLYHTMPHHVNGFNNHSGLRGLPRFAEGVCWATGLSLTTPFTEVPGS